MMNEHERRAERIVSLLPSATEIAFALGLGDRVVGVSHECDYPPEVRARPVVVHCAVSLEGLAPGEVDAAVSAQLRSGGSIYEVDAEMLRMLDPDLILAQDLCEVCAPSANETTRVLRSLDRQPEVIPLTPRSLRDIEENLRTVGLAAGCLVAAEEVIARSRARLTRVGGSLQGAPRRRVFFMEWIDPIYCGGHWVPEMIELAGGMDAIGRRGSDSVRVTFDQIADWAPEVMLVSPCGAHLDEALAQARSLLDAPRWADLAAVRSGNVFAVDASSYFARPGPRVFEGVELLAHLIHPERVAWDGAPDAYQRVTVTR